jgi:hypothetical protein
VPRDPQVAARRLPAEPDPAILRLARALARQAAREDHAREQMNAKVQQRGPAGEQAEAEEGQP